MADLYGTLQQQQTQPQRRLNPSGQNLFGEQPSQPPAPASPDAPQRVTATPLQASPQQPSPQPPAPPAPALTPAPQMDPGQAAAAGLGWVPRDHPLYGTPGYVGSTPQSGGGATGGPAPAVPGVPGNVAPELKNPTQAPPPTTQATPAPQVGLGSTVDAPQGQPQNPQQQMQGMLRSSIMGLLNTNPNAVSMTDADIAPQSQAFRAAAERSEAKRRAETVHQAQRGGWGSSGGLDQRLDALSQQTGQAVGAHDAALLGQQQGARRQQLQQAIAAASQLGLADEANNLSRQLANLDASVQTRGQDIGVAQIGAQRDLANLDASTRIYLGDLSAQMQREGVSAQERMARLDAELRRHGIDTQGRLGELDAALRGQLGNRQIDLGYDQLGVNVGEIQARMNRDAVMAGLGG